MTPKHIWVNHYLPMIPGLHPFKLDCRDVLGFFLAEQGSCASKGINSQQSSTSPPLFHKQRFQWWASNQVGLGVTTVLTMTTLINSVNAALPKISYMKSIDIYLFVCFFMVFGALIEYACVGWVIQHIWLRLTLTWIFDQVHRQKNPTEKKSLPGHAEDDGGEEAWSENDE